MNRDQVWEKIKGDKGAVYGEPMLHMFLRITQDLERRHWDGLTKAQRELPNPNIRLAHSQNDAERERNLKEILKDAEDKYAALDNALFQAARHGDEKNCRWLVDMGAEDLWNALVYAAMGGHLNLCKSIQQMAERDGKKLDFCEALSAAAQQGHLEVCKWTMSRESGARCVDEALEDAAWGGHIPTIEWLIQNGARRIEKALYSAAGNGKIEACQWLIDRGAKDLDGALFHAKVHKQEKAQRFLIEKGAKPRMPER